MRYVGSSMAFLSNIVFPMIYQIIFSYFLILSVGTQSSAALVIIATTLVGTPLMALDNHRRLQLARRSSESWLSIRPLFSAMLLPLAQTGLLAVLYK